MIGKWLAHGSISLNLALGIVYYLDLRNPMMGFLVGAPFLVLAVAAGACSIATAVLLLTGGQKTKQKTGIGT